jgi:hypothetical protein
MLRNTKAIGASLTLLLALPSIVFAQDRQLSRSVVLPPPSVDDLGQAEPAVAKLFTNGTWQISKDDVVNLESALPQISSLKVRGWPATIHVDHAEKYFRQYFAVIRGGKKLIYVNAFCKEEPGTNWRERLFVVSDGATCYWQVFFDPALKRFSELAFNALG